MNATAEQNEILGHIWPEDLQTTQSSLHLEQQLIQLRDLLRGRSAEEVRRHPTDGVQLGEIVDEINKITEASNG